jgi:hypothetical protein
MVRPAGRLVWIAAGFPLGVVNILVAEVAMRAL